MSRVEKIQMLEVEVLRETPEVRTSPRGWGEGAIQHAMLKVEDDYILVTAYGQTYRVDKEVVEAIYTFWQEQRYP